MGRSVRAPSSPPLIWQLVSTRGSRRRDVSPDDLIGCEEFEAHKHASRNDPSVSGGCMLFTDISVKSGAKKHTRESRASFPSRRPVRPLRDEHVWAALVLVSLPLFGRTAVLLLSPEISAHTGPRLREMRVPRFATYVGLLAMRRRALRGSATSLSPMLPTMSRTAGWRPAVTPSALLLRRRHVERRRRRRRPRRGCESQHLHRRRIDSLGRLLRRLLRPWRSSLRSPWSSRDGPPRHCSAVVHRTRGKPRGRSPDGCSVAST